MSSPPPQFPRRDPSDPEFWDLRYAAAFAPWDAGKIPAQLRAFVASHRPASVLVPGCGSGWDVRCFAEAGWNVLGIDFSTEALAAAQPVLGPHASRIRQADFFAPIAEAPFDLIYERAFLCALPRTLWAQWGTRMAELMKPGGRLVGYFYLGEGERGPPFPLHSQAELDALLEPAFDRVEDAPVPDSIPVFEGKERWQVWRRR
jgi:thiopurine S-methyltransferase